jgi:PAS domain S-box-containing protein
MPTADTDENLLFGVIALQSDLISMQQFVDGCTLWSSRKESSLADVLIGQGWLNDEDRRHVEYLLQRRLKKSARNPRETIAALPPDIKGALAGINDGAIRASLQIGQPGAALRGPLQPKSAPQLREKITMMRLHSSGGIGQVWIAYDQILEREVALKELRADMANSLQNRDRFFREAQLTGQLEHPGIVPVYEFVSESGGGRSFYTMRFVKGRTLTDSIHAYHEERKKESAFRVATEFIKLLNAFVSVCQTIAYAHSRDVIHRDLKGDNVILGDFGEVIVLDWGLAKRLDGSDAGEAAGPDIDPSKTVVMTDSSLKSPMVTMQGEKLGTPAYMAPEQATGKIDEIDRRTDVYGLAAILYEILTGEPPFLGKSLVEVLHRVIHEQPKPPRDHVPGVPTDLERICLQGLSKSRSDRQESASELAQQVQCWIAERADRKRTEQERERFFNLSLDLLAIIDARGKLKQTNPAWTTILGWEQSELADMTVWQVLDAEEHEQVTRNFERILAGEAFTAVDRRCVCKDGTHRWVQWNASLIAGESSVYIVGRDITERKQAERTFQELIESAPDGMVIVRESGQIVLVNTQIENLFGYTREELLGQAIEILVPEKFRAAHPAHVREFVRTPQFRPMGAGLKLYGQRKDGGVFPVEISLSPVKTEQGRLISCTVREGRH